MNWQQHSIELIDLKGIQCRFTSNGYATLGWIMPDGAGVFHEGGVIVECQPETIVTDDPEGLRLARAASASNHFQRHDQGYKVTDAAEWVPTGDKWVRQYRVGLADQEGTLSVHVQFKAGSAELLRFYTEFVSDPRPAKTVADPVRQGRIGGAYSAGEVVRSASGRLCSPFPKIDLGGERKASNTLKRVDQWLMQNALDEAQARGDEFNALQFRASLGKPQQADKDCAEQYLFGQQPAVIPSPLKFLTCNG
ncbi:hypothetical protein N0609_11640 [Pseudomonas aeruginosa]|uniref:hypothetical protein n=1 Tax=Ectopseudomonas hydrolytica TaxID=2493633 RepID=UPI0031B69C83|nr:hypothetical protein [Pseudomonas aeruginosa]MCS8510356.1 hypothetical protein [Pseudomonas aeruginosa]MCS8541136.1 hypothetical protein [Pseudomonas aeruginosa]MCT0600282.1 hypothetical protein [Pseudomonas aeruginosa]